MTQSHLAPSFYIGWDVGGWNCEKNGKSRDAIVILDAALQIVGKPWRGNLRTTLNAVNRTDAFIDALFALCGCSSGLAIATPLGFPQALVELVTGFQCVEPIDQSSTNPYLFRHTERFLFAHGLKPLSAVKDMIGSQATKGMHALAQFAPRRISCGVWTDARHLVAIEAYPSACKTSHIMANLLQGFPALNHPDQTDALTCALVAYLFDQRREALAAPYASVPPSEGWIWVTRDSLA